MACMRYADFRPTIPSEEGSPTKKEAIRFALSQYGLSATVWTKRTSLSLRDIAHRLESRVNINYAYLELCSASSTTGRLETFRPRAPTGSRAGQSGSTAVRRPSPHTTSCHAWRINCCVPLLSHPAARIVIALLGGRSLPATLGRETTARG